MKISYWLSLLIACCISSAWADYSGTVFQDTNKNGVHDQGEKGLSQVSVSDGLNVVKTDKNGQFTLPGHEKARFIFITLPSGFETNKFYKTIQDGKFEFALTPARVKPGKRGTHHFLHITDTEIFNTANQEDWLHNLKNYARNTDASFIIHTGDICYEKGLKEHITILNSENSPCPVFYCIGNHDLVSGKYGEELYESLYGPTFYSFDIGNTHYIVTPMLSGDHRPGYTKEDVYRWMKNDLAQVPADKSLIIFNHDILTSGDQFDYGINDKDKINLNERNLKAWIYGHWHINYMKKQGDVFTICSSTLDKGGIDHSKSAFRDISLDGKGNPSSQIRYTYLKDRVHIASLCQDNHPLLADGSIPLSVNAYHSDVPTTAVSCTITVDGKKNATVKLTPKTDWNWGATLTASPKWEGKKVTLSIKAAFGNNLSATTEGSFTYRKNSVAPVKTGENWNNLLGNPEHIGASKDTVAPPLSLAWAANVGSNIYMTSPLISDGKVFVATIDEDMKGRAHVDALDAKTGKKLWQYPVRNSIKNTIAIDGDLVFAQDVDGNLYALDKDKGTLQWEKKLPVNGIPALIEGIVADKGIVYVGAGKALSAYNAKTGTPVWVNNSWSQHDGTTTTLALGNDVLVAGSQWQALFANNATDGKLLWRADQNGLRNRGASAAIHGDTLYIISEKSLFIMETKSGKVLTRKELPYSVDVTSTPLVTEGEIIFGTAQNGLVALNKDNLEQKWNYKTGDALIFTAPYTRAPSSSIETSPVQSGDIIYVGASDGTFSALDRKTGKLLWKHATGAPVLGSVAISGNALFGVDFSGNVYAFTPDSRKN